MYLMSMSDYIEGSNRPRPTSAISENETPLMFLMRMFDEGKLKYVDGDIYSHFSGKGRGSWRDTPKKVGNKDKRGYVYYRYRFNGRGRSMPVHRIVYAYFNGLREFPEGLVINHIDGDKSNNRIENLELCTHKENIFHAFNEGLATREGRPDAKLTWKDVDEIRYMYENTPITRRQLAASYEVSWSCITNIVTYKNWIRRYKIEKENQI